MKWESRYYNPDLTNGNHTEHNSLPEKNYSPEEGKPMATEALRLLKLNDFDDPFPERARTYIVVFSLPEGNVEHVVRSPYQDTVDAHEMRAALKQVWKALDEKYADKSKYDMMLERGTVASILNTIPALVNWDSKKTEDLPIPI